MTRDEIISIVQTFISRLRPEVDVLRVYAFGSMVRGDAEPGSDLDLLLEVPQENPVVKHRIREIAWELSLDVGMVISVIVVGEHELHQGPLSITGLARDIENEGIEIAA